MGRLIDYNDVYNAIQITTDNFGVAKRVVDDNMLTMLSKIETVEAIPKADYETRLKADMVAMLEEIQLEIEESENCGKAFHLGLQMASNIIQQKIDAIKEQKDETDESNK